MVKKREDYEVGKDVSGFIDRTKRVEDRSRDIGEKKERRGCRISVYVTEKMEYNLKAISKMQNKNLTLTIAELLDEVLKKEEYQKILKAYEMAKEYMR